MASELFVDNITGKTGTSGGAPITLSGDTATLSGTGVTFPAGHVVQVVQSRYDDGYTTTLADGNDKATGLYVDITPKFNTSKILFLASTTVTTDGTQTHFRYIRIYRDSTILNYGSLAWAVKTRYSFITNTDYMPVTIEYLDSPNTIEQVRYELYVNDSASGSISIGERTNGSPNSTSITAMEIAG